MKILQLILLVFVPGLLFGQKEDVLKKLFFGLNLSQSHEVNREILQADSSFVDLRNFLGDAYLKWAPIMNLSSYYGKAPNNELIIPKSDSTILYLMTNVGSSFCYDCGDSTSITSVSYHTIETHLEYYYRSKKSLKKAYTNLLTYLTAKGLNAKESKDAYGNPRIEIVFEDKNLVDAKTLVALNRRPILVDWPVLLIQKVYDKKQNSLNITFERKQVN